MVLAPDARTPPLAGQRPAVLGILNTTPDSFSDGGLYDDRDAAVAHGLRLTCAGADIIDVGGESTRPGAARVPEEVELARVVPVIEDLVSAGVRVSIDTTRAHVAAAAVSVGACMINDISGGLADREMAAVARAAQVPFVAMHWRGHSDRMQQAARYGDVVAEVVEELRGRREALLECGIAPERIVLDPGIGFAKRSEHSWALLAALPRFAELGAPLMVGVSRKSLLDELSDEDQRLSGPDRDVATAVLSGLLLRCTSYVRVHDVHATVLALRVAEKLRADR
ncbi:dihydropteroate synthase [Nocardioides sp. LMS-CY]|uniref:dihydropteroate synthase n=1 Tax=Nocardioides sp. (strain LMS-CY) TaxID=2840457 RepID=UPI001C002BE5|nr:dihydropteroate synthase [Nocardioides sp. LMS-CY]QWF20485.1 dihydropteroate synthase [Nocardioides sp. LMS-CY]